MKTKIYCIVLFSIFLLTCKKDEKMMYSSKDNIYLNYTNAGEDSTTITYSFATSPGLARDTIWIPVAVSGKTSNHDRKFILSAVDNTTTAVRGFHFEKLQPYYTMPADSALIHVPVILMNIDTGLASKSVNLTVLVSGGEDFNSDLPTRIRSKSIQYSNRLEKPSWWMYWQGQLGPYSRVTHQLFLISSGTKDDLVNPTAPNAYLQIPRTLYYLDNTRIFVQDPFTWVTRYPEKGFVITPRNNGTKDYDFYSAASPEIKFHVKYYEQLDRYFFMNENGDQIIM